MRNIQLFDVFLQTLKIIEENPGLTLYTQIIIISYHTVLLRRTSELSVGLSACNFTAHQEFANLIFMYTYYPKAYNNYSSYDTPMVLPNNGNQKPRINTNSRMIAFGG